jgi:ABC-type multidrug transport system ATPase subunit
VTQVASEWSSAGRQAVSKRGHQAVEVRDLVKVYAQPGGGTLRAVDAVSFAIPRGKFFGFLGPNGAGKTTTLEIIEGLSLRHDPS